MTPVASPKVLNVPALVALASRQPGLQPHVVPGATDDEPSEETRHNRATFDFIPCNKLQTKTGLRAAFASVAADLVSSRIDGGEGHWVPVGKSKSGKYHIKTASDSKRYALVSSKQIFVPVFYVVVMRYFGRGKERASVRAH
ncbi:MULTISPECIES: hypothetical protein [Bradyrhizobium]|uniref:hypothetical protein n=1 Tax=Bradyrhizobium TaxID=374 RepID=UPI000F528603|nr:MULTISPECIES: hypothetical protein [Bradyrhizobium]RQH05219.1 hypothetical protein EHH60_32640 [Bradyrhizobium sp. RP6]UWU93650.1 hypothetical protein N2604_07105 [Bradyrhizobium sp. CB1015]